MADQQPTPCACGCASAQDCFTAGIARPCECAWDDGAQDALNRMARAARRGTGCTLTAEMIASLAVTIIGQAWAEADPRKGDRDGKQP